MTGTPGGSAAQPAVFFDEPGTLREWLQAHHADRTELWIELRRKGSDDRGITWRQLVEEALCFGWIDSRAEGIDEVRRRQRLTPRKKSSNWSAVNIALMAELEQQGRMTPAGSAIFESRNRANDAVYSHENDTALSPEFATALAAHPAATAFWELATPSYRRVATHWVMTAKQAATRDSRMQSLITDSAAHELIKSQRYGTEPAWVRTARETLAAPSATDEAAGP